MKLENLDEKYTVYLSGRSNNQFELAIISDFNPDDDIRATVDADQIGDQFVIRTISWHHSRKSTIVPTYVSGWHKPVHIQQHYRPRRDDSDYFPLLQTYMDKILYRVMCEGSDYTDVTVGWLLGVV